VAIGSEDDFTVDDRETRETTAENYMLQARYDRKVSERMFWFGGAGWDRNVPAGVDNRYTGFAGVGNTWIEREDLRFKTDYALTYTDQKDVIPNPEIEDSFLGARLAYVYFHKFNDITSFDQDLTIDENLDDTDDWRARLGNALTVTMTKRLALGVRLVFEYDNQPALDAVPLFDIDPGFPGAAEIGTVLVEKDELDTIFTTSLVAKF
jgi:hypothetical protein